MLIGVLGGIREMLEGRVNGLGVEAVRREWVVDCGDIDDVAAEASRTDD